MPNQASTAEQEPLADTEASTETGAELPRERGSGVQSIIGGRKRIVLRSLTAWSATERSCTARLASRTSMSMECCRCDRCGSSRLMTMGIASAEYIMGEDPGLTLTLGSVPVNLTNMTGAYGVFAQKGVLHPPTTIIEIRDRDNRVVYTREDDLPPPKRPMTAAEACAATPAAMRGRWAR